MAHFQQKHFHDPDHKRVFNELMYYKHNLLLFQIENISGYKDGSKVNHDQIV